MLDYNAKTLINFFLENPNSSKSSDLKELVFLNCIENEEIADSYVLSVEVKRDVQMARDTLVVHDRDELSDIPIFTDLNELFFLYATSVFYSVSLSEEIERKYLADLTGVDYEPGEDPEDYILDKVPLRYVYSLSEAKGLIQEFISIYMNQYSRLEAYILDEEGDVKDIKNFSSIF